MGCTEKRREKNWSGKIIHINHSHEDIPATLAKIEETLKKRNPAVWPRGNPFRRINTSQHPFQECSLIKDQDLFDNSHSHYHLWRQHCIFNELISRINIRTKQFISYQCFPGFALLFYNSKSISRKACLPQAGPQKLFRKGRKNCYSFVLNFEEYSSTKRWVLSRILTLSLWSLLRWYKCFLIFKVDIDNCIKRETAGPLSSWCLFSSPIPTDNFSIIPTCSLPRRLNNNARAWGLLFKNKIWIILVLVRRIDK